MRNNITKDRKPVMIEELKYEFRINGSNKGLWIDNDSHSNVQVMMIDGNFTVLTLCEKTQLISFIMSRERSLNVTEVSFDSFKFSTDSCNLHLRKLKLHVRLSNDVV